MKEYSVLLFINFMKNMKLCIILVLLFFDCHSALEYFDSENPFDLEQLTPINLIEGFYNNEDIISLDCTYSLASILFYNQTKDPLSHLRCKYVVLVL